VRQGAADEVTCYGSPKRVAPAAEAWALGGVGTEAPVDLLTAVQAELGRFLDGKESADAVRNRLVELLRTARAAPRPPDILAAEADPQVEITVYVDGSQAQEVPLAPGRSAEEEAHARAIFREALRRSRKPTDAT
jgi:hypothetical protein